MFPASSAIWKRARMRIWKGELLGVEKQKFYFSSHLGKGNI
jgi:hypothetical protein